MWIGGHKVIIMKKRACGYIWISPSTTEPEQIIEGIQIRVQTYCDENEIELIKMYKDIGTIGVALKRPQMVEMLGNIDDDKIDMLILDSLGNVGRRFHDAVMILNKFAFMDTGLISIAEDINTTTDKGKQLLQTLIRIPQLAQWTKPKTEEKRVRAKEVLYNGGACPYGYEIDEKTNQYVVVPAEASIIKRIFRERLAGRSLRQIAGDLTKEGIKTKRGGRWQANTIKTILENIFYTGIYECHGTIYRNDHDEVISEHLFRQVNEMEEVLQQVL